MIRSIRRFQNLAKVIGESKIVTSIAAQNQFGHDESPHPFPLLPKAVITPETKRDVVEIVNWCSENEVSIIPYGTGSGLEGGVIALNDNSVTVDMSKMSEILFVSEEDLYCVVQPGVTREQLNEHLRATGLFFPVDPGANASLGGMAATSASGTSAVRFGTMKENVINMEVVLPSGEILHTSGDGRSFRKSSAGLNLTELFVGSEGTLGMITQLTLRLHPQPEATVAAVCQFDSVSDAVMSAVQALQYNIPLAKVELLDSRSIQAVNAYSKTALAEKPTLFLEFQGSESAIAEQREMFADIAEENGSISWKQADTLEERNSLWKARHSLWFAFLSQAGNLDGEGWRGYSTDVCVPISKLDEMIKAAEKIMEGTYAEGIFAFLGHVGDGNFHIFIPVNDETFSELKEISHKVGLAALELGGTCTGEHGVGLGKQQLMALERGAVAVDLMKTIKKSIDEKNLMNPGKVIPF